MQASLYNIVIAFPNGGTAPSDGNIDPTTITEYMALNDAAPTTLANSLAKTRANTRYKFLCQQLQLNQNIYVTEYTATGADCNTAPTSFNFIAVVEHGDSSIFTYDETTNYTTSLTGISALTRMVARALIEARESIELCYYDPTETAAPGNTTTVARMGYRIDVETVGAVTTSLTLADAMISITKIA